jgi:hypothetical protein
MKINLEKPSEYGDFSIEPTGAKEISAVYFDYETKLLIVEEIADEGGNSRPVYVTTIDARAGRAIPIDERKNFIDYSERSETDESLGLKRTFRREINAETGNEFIIEKLYQADAEVSRSRRVAFSMTAPATIFDSYKQRLKEQKREELFWQTEYRAKNFEQRAAYWASMMFRHMRWQSESGLDEYAGFTPEWYDHAKNRDPEFDEILSFIFERYGSEFDYQGHSTGEIRRRIFGGMKDEG